jgi:hypothetical protein
LGGLRRHLVVKKARRYKKWLLLPIFIVLLLWGVHLYRANSQAGLLEYALAKTLPTGVELVHGNGQIYYEYRGKQHFVTNDDHNHQSPTASGQYITWLDESGGRYQVVLYDLAYGQRLELSSIGDNTNPSIYHGKVAWQGDSNSRAVIYYFDGHKVRQINSNYPAIRPYVYRNYVLFAEQLPGKDNWQAVQFDMSSQKSKVLTTGPNRLAGWPRYENGKIRTTLVGSSQYQD